MRYQRRHQVGDAWDLESEMTKDDVRRYYEAACAAASLAPIGTLYWEDVEADEEMCESISLSMGAVVAMAQAEMRQAPSTRLPYGRLTTRARHR